MDIITYLMVAWLIALLSMPVLCIWLYSKEMRSNNDVSNNNVSNKAVGNKDNKGNNDEGGTIRNEIGFNHLPYGNHGYKQCTRKEWIDSLNSKELDILIKYINDRMTTLNDMEERHETDKTDS